MKKLKVLLLMLAVLLVVPFGVFADEAKEEAKDEVVESKEVKLYLFYGDGCGFCQKAKEWFAEIEEDYGDKFEVVQYEVWYNQENSELMNAVASARKETPGGVPYIIVGNQSWDGFSDEYKDSIISKIESEYKQDPAERYDVMDYINLEVEKKDTTARDILLIIVLVGVVGAITAGVVIARKTTN